MALSSRSVTLSVHSLKQCISLNITDEVMLFLNENEISEKPKKINKLPWTSTYHQRYSNLGGLKRQWEERTPLSVYSVTDKE